jgi:hypothetical protein
VFSFLSLAVLLWLLKVKLQPDSAESSGYLINLGFSWPERKIRSVGGTNPFAGDTGRMRLTTAGNSVKPFRRKLL